MLGNFSSKAVLIRTVVVLNGEKSNYMYRRDKYLQGISWILSWTLKWASRDPPWIQSSGSRCRKDAETECFLQINTTVCVCIKPCTCTTVKNMYIYMYYNYSSTMVVTFWPIRLLKRRLINHISTPQVIYQPTSYLSTCNCGAWLAHCCKKNRHFCTSLRDIATADDEERAHLFVCQILGALREGNRSAYLRLMAGQSRPYLWTYSSSFHRYWWLWMAK